MEDQTRKLARQPKPRGGITAAELQKKDFGDGAPDLWPTLSPTQFQVQFDTWLKQHEAAKPFAKLRELEGRIKTGDGKLRAAEQRGVAPDDAAYLAAVAKLQGLKDERDGLIRSASIPHFAMAEVHNFLRASQGWGLPAGSSIEIQVPGVFGMKVDLSANEPPF